MVSSESEFPIWCPHEHPEYDVILGQASEAVHERLNASSSEDRMAFVLDPRSVHRFLYEKLVPEGFDEYAGTYRGTAGTSLESRTISAIRQTDGLQQIFLLPEKVASRLETLVPTVQKIFNGSRASSKCEFLLECSKLFYTFGLLHPFLDGNGHIQRLIFLACLAERKDLKLQPSWTVHPRPYDIEMALAFEKGTTEERLSAVQQVLSQYVINVGSEK